MMRLFSLFVITTLFAAAGEKLPLPSTLLVGGAVATIFLFFWGIYKAVRTQDIKYAWALLPFILLLTFMFFL